MYYDDLAFLKMSFNGIVHHIFFTHPIIMLSLPFIVDIVSHHFVLIKLWKL